MTMIHTVFELTGSMVLLLVFVILFAAETKFELRGRKDSRWLRFFINSVVSIPSFALLRLVFIPTMVWLAVVNQKTHFGLGYLFDIPSWIVLVLAFLTLDYGNYLWHRLNHRIPFLWRFHLVHHTDLDLDITTAFRFHFGELLGSVFFRGAFTFLCGATPLAVFVYEIVFECATQFHHSNLRLPIATERVLNKIIVTPRMHGIHHSNIKEEADSNYAVVFSFWDRLHQTIKLHISQCRVVPGVPSYNRKEELGIWFLWKLPFTSIRKWQEKYLTRQRLDKEGGKGPMQE